MNIALDISNIDFKNIHFLESKNNIVIDGEFTKIIFSHSSFVLNGIYIYLSNRLKMTTHPSFKNMAVFDVFSNENRKFIQELSKLENNVIHYYSKLHASTRIITKALSQQLHEGAVRFYKDNKRFFSNGGKEAHYILKISGIWENSTEIGITYKFIQVYDVEL